MSKRISFKRSVVTTKPVVANDDTNEADLEKIDTDTANQMNDDPYDIESQRAHLTSTVSKIQDNKDYVFNPEDEEEEAEEDEEEAEEEDVEEEYDEDDDTGVVLEEPEETDDEEVDETDDDSDMMEEHMAKINDQLKKEYLLDFHPEVKMPNFQELNSLVVVVRDEFGNVIDPLHKTAPILSKYERARVLGVRAKQINNGAEVFVDVPEEVIEGYVIAEKELTNKVLPFIIRRPLPNGRSEYWRLADLEIVNN